MGISSIGLLTAFVAGIVSFLSPCVLPLVPGYLSAVAGVSPDELEVNAIRRVLPPALLFVASFSLIFVLLGLGATAIGGALQANRELLDKVAAGIITTLGFVFLATPFVARLGHEWHSVGLLTRAGRGGPIVAGAAFAIAWTPCIGPTLAAILSAAAVSGSAAHGALLLSVYSAGLAIPFVLTALAFGRLTATFSVVKAHYGVIVAIGGAVLVGMGVLTWTGELFRLNIEAQRTMNDLGINLFNL